MQLSLPCVRKGGGSDCGTAGVWDGLVLMAASSQSCPRDARSPSCCPFFAAEKLLGMKNNSDDKTHLRLLRGPKEIGFCRFKILRKFVIQVEKTTVESDRGEP